MLVLILLDHHRDRLRDIRRHLTPMEQQCQSAIVTTADRLLVMKTISVRRPGGMHRNHVLLLLLIQTKMVLLSKNVALAVFSNAF